MGKSNLISKQEFCKIMLGLCELYKQESTDFVIDVYYEIFREYTLISFRQAVIKVMREHKYNSLPKPATILEALNGNGTLYDLINKR